MTIRLLLADDQATLARFEHGHDEAFDHAAGWLYEGMANAYRGGAARLAIAGDDPSLLAGQDPDKVARANRARSKAYMPALEQIANFSTNWTIVSAATPAWARTVFPDLPEDQAVVRLWDAIFSASRVDGPDPVGAWEAHNRALSDRTAYLNARRYAALHFRGPGTDLTVGLADDHEWCGGATTAKNGIVCNANIPTEEVFTTPHRLRVQGHVSATKPLSYQGTLIDGIAVRFEEGRIVEARARTGGDVLAKVIDTDEGARRLGETARVDVRAESKRAVVGQPDCVVDVFDAHDRQHRAKRFGADEVHVVFDEQDADAFVAQLPQQRRELFLLHVTQAGGGLVE